MTLRLCFILLSPSGTWCHSKDTCLPETDWDHTTLGLLTYDVAQACHSHHPTLPRPPIFASLHPLDPTFVIQSHGPPSCPILGDRYWQNTYPVGVGDSIPPPPNTRPFEVISMDLITQLPKSRGKDAILLCPHVSGLHQDRKVFVPYLWRHALLLSYLNPSIEVVVQWIKKLSQCLAILQRLK